jgi:FMN phosphatase YigB (HAD superfamily)
MEYEQLPTMFGLSDTLSASSIPTQDVPSSGRRYYRSRNSLSVKSFDWSSYHSIPVDTPFWDDMICNSARAGLDAAKQSLKPAFFVWAMMAVVAVFYYAVPASQGFFAALTALQNKLGLLFPFLGMGLAVGILAEVVKVLISDEKRWTRSNTINALFNLSIFGVLGVAEFFHATRCADETASKPDPLMLEELLAEFGVEAGDAVMIGDTEYDMEMARLIGMPRIAVSYGAHHIDRLHSYRPEMCLDQFDQLLAWEKLAG